WSTPRSPSRHWRPWPGACAPSRRSPCSPPARAEAMTEVPDEVRALSAERDERRRAKDFAAADALRDRIARLGFSVIDGPDGVSLEPLAVTQPHRIRAADLQR